MLADLQRALGEAVRRGVVPNAPVGVLDLTPAEHAFLTRLAVSAGFHFTCSVQRSWCERRTRNAARIVLAALAPERACALVDEWIARGGGTSSFFMSESEELLELIAQRLPDPSPELSLCRVEQAVHRANLVTAPFAPPAALPADAHLMRGRGAALVTIAPTGLAVIFAPGLPDLHRAAEPDEEELWRACAAPTAHAALLAAGHARERIAALVAAGVLELL